MLKSFLSRFLHTFPAHRLTLGSFFSSYVIIDGCNTQGPLLIPASGNYVWFIAWDKKLQILRIEVNGEAYSYLRNLIQSRKCQISVACTCTVYIVSYLPIYDVDSSEVL